jgi:predicted transcriptional regulator
MLIDIYAKLRNIFIMSGRVTNKQIVQMLRNVVRMKSQREVADDLGLSPAFVCDVLKGRREVTERLAKKMGYRKVVEFEKVA